MNDFTKLINQIKKYQILIPSILEPVMEARMIIQTDNMIKALIDVHGAEKVREALKWDS